MASHAAKERQLFPALTGLRFVAASMVFFFHYLYHFENYEPVFRFAKELHTGVTVFFVLSGFLITYRYLSSYRTTLKWWNSYLRNRVARIYPVYLLMSVTTLLVAGTQDPKEWFLTLTLLKGYSYELRFNGIRQAWTLTVEETFYLTAPLVFLWMRRLPLSLAAALLFGIGAAIVHAGGLGKYLYMVNATYFGFASAFFWGVWLARILLSERPPRFRLPATWTGAIGSLLVIASLTLFQPEGFSGNDYWATSLGTAGGSATHLLLLPPFVMLLIYGLMDERTVLRWALSTQPAQLLGKASYGFYLIHLGIIPDYLRRPDILGNDVAMPVLFLSLWVI